MPIYFKVTPLSLFLTAKSAFGIAESHSPGTLNGVGSDELSNKWRHLKRPSILIDIRKIK